MTIVTGQYRQSCYNCGQPTGHTDNCNEIEIFGSCCADLPPIWDMGANGLYGTDAGVGRRDREGYILEFGDDAYDEDEHEDPDACNCGNCLFGDRYSDGELTLHEFDDLSRTDADWYRDQHGMPDLNTITR